MGTKTLVRLVAALATVAILFTAGCFSTSAPSSSTTDAGSVPFVSLPTADNSVLHSWGEVADFDGISMSIEAPKVGTIEPSLTPGVTFDPEEYLVGVLVSVTNHTDRLLSITSYSFQAQDQSGGFLSGENRPTLDPPFPTEPIAPGQTARGYESWVLSLGGAVTSVSFSSATRDDRTTTQIWGE